MKVIVKLLGKSENVFEVSSTSTIESLKTQVEPVFNIPVSQQKLVFKGKTLADTKDIGSYNIGEGEKIFLFVKKSTESSTPKSQTKVSKGPLLDKVETLLLKHFPKESVPLILENFEKEIKELPYTLSLEDIERISEANLEAGKNSSWCGHS